MPKPADFWNDRFSTDEYVYGVRPNDFVEEAAQTWLSSSRDVLDLAVGEGRNAVFLARRGHVVTAVDYSTEALRKTKALATEVDVDIECIQADVRHWAPERRWDAVIVTFLHLPPDDRPAMYALIQNLLRPGGVLVGEWFRPEQRTGGYKSGGPPTPEMMITPAELRKHFPTQGIEYLEAVEPVLEEGMHRGPAATVRFIWRPSD